eukprot:Rmarinus@m.29443
MGVILLLLHIVYVLLTSVDCLHHRCVAIQLQVDESFEDSKFSVKSFLGQVDILDSQQFSHASQVRLVNEVEDLENGDYQLSLYDSSGDGGISGIISDVDGTSLLSWDSTDWTSTFEADFTIGYDIGFATVQLLVDSEFDEAAFSISGPDGAFFVNGVNFTFPEEELVFRIPAFYGTWHLFLWDRGGDGGVSGWVNASNLDVAAWDKGSWQTETTIAMDFGEDPAGVVVSIKVGAGGASATSATIGAELLKVSGPAGYVSHLFTSLPGEGEETWATFQRSTMQLTDGDFQGILLFVGAGNTALVPLDLVRVGVPHASNGMLTWYCWSLFATLQTNVTSEGSSSEVVALVSSEFVCSSTDPCTGPALRLRVVTPTANMQSPPDVLIRFEFSSFPVSLPFRCDLSPTGIEMSCVYYVVEYYYDYDELDAVTLYLENNTDSRSWTSSSVIMDYLDSDLAVSSTVVLSSTNRTLCSNSVGGSIPTAAAWTFDVESGAVCGENTIQEEECELNECYLGTATCSEDATCADVVGSFECTCNTGYDGDGVSCSDVDECESGAHSCSTLATCVNSPGSFVCTCNAGFTGSGKICVDLDECDWGSHDCSSGAASCSNADGSFLCACNAGYDGDGVACGDLNECELATHNCDSHSGCVNTTGSFKCYCNAGYWGSGLACSNVDECSSGSHDCSIEATCDDVSGSFECVCDTGYTGDGVVCQDIDECTLLTHDCDGNATCANSDGSFSCACNAGYSGYGLACQDVDECASGLDDCDALAASCENAIGSFLCTCNVGYEGYGTSCSDVDECDVGSHTCTGQALCTNVDGSFSCGCPVGYEGDSVNCWDLNECATEVHTCDAMANCTNVAGSFACQCWTGYDGDGETCEDVDECSSFIHNCAFNSTCGNNEGSFTCACNSGFAGDGVDCALCAAGQFSGAGDGECTTCPANTASTEGSEFCNCVAGFAGPPGGPCTECPVDSYSSAGAATCSPCPANTTSTSGGSVCVCDVGYGVESNGIDCSPCPENTYKNVTGLESCLACPSNSVSPMGSDEYLDCVCGAGFEGKVLLGCQDVNECALFDDTCHAMASCENTIGSYTCSCFEEYAGNGVTCVDVTTKIPILYTPADNDTLISSFEVVFSLPEAACAGCVQIRFLCSQCTGADGIIDAYGERVVTLDDTYETEGYHSIRFFGLADNDTWANGVIDIAPAVDLVDLAEYTVTISYRDALWNARANASALRVVYDRQTSLPVLFYPLSYSSVTVPFRVSILLTEAASTLELTITWQGGTLDPVLYRNVTLEASKFSPGETTSFDLGLLSSAEEIVYVVRVSPAADLLHNAMYSFSLWQTDAGGNVGDPISNLNVTYDVATDPAVWVSPVEGSEFTLFDAIVFSLPEAPQADSLQLQFDFIPGTIVPSPTNLSFSFALPVEFASAGSHSLTLWNSAPAALLEAFADRAGYLLTFSYSDVLDNEFATSLLSEAIYEEDACRDGTHGCSPGNSECVNIVGGYYCSCNVGWAGFGLSCVDVLECSDGVHNCHVDADCTNSDGSFSCTCNAGYVGSGTSCENSAECILGVHDCDPQATCTDAEGSFSCTCNVGFLGSGVSCVDEDECRGSKHPCDENAVCINSYGSFACTCNVGYEGDGVSCDDILECESGIHDCDGLSICTNTPGSFACQCETGYDGSGALCNDVNECELATHNCHTNAICGNSVGSFACSCNTGFSGDGFSCADILECELGTHDCASTARCTNTAGTFTCSCGAGYVGDGVSCSDADECELDLHDCISSASCYNTYGSYFCACNAGYSGDGSTCEDSDECVLGVHNCHVSLGTCFNNEGSFSCACDAGYSGSGVTCIDLNECAFEPTTCHENASCTDIVGSFYCTCGASYSGDGLFCDDKNECELGLHTCSPVAYCTNTEGAYTCECLPGYSGDGESCINVNECFLGSHTCAMELASCIDTAGSFTCFCSAVGYSGDGVSCSNVDECSMGTADCHADQSSCLDTAGSFQCTCNTGYSGNGTHCEDLVECLDGLHNCSPHATCENTDASFMCSCNIGFSGDGIDCVDEDACVTGMHDCSSYGTCTNTEGSFSCLCLIGFTGDGVLCEDVPECSLAVHTCHAAASCDETLGSFTCTCKMGYVGNGTYCAEVDECTTGEHTCAGEGTCMNNLGSFSCSCNEGFTGNGTICSDVEECLDGLHTCDDVVGVCTNTAGSFSCSCPPGYSGNGTTCSDVEECSAGVHNCHPLASCIASIGSFDCVCAEGYVGTGTTTCNNIDECSSQKDDCHGNADCVDTMGSFECTCDRGFSGNGTFCTQDDECVMATHNCDPLGTCVDTLGSFACQCPDGYSGNGLRCTDINECDDGACGELGTCLNTAGSHTCTCALGAFLSTTGTCRDMNECLGEIHDCAAAADCSNTEGSFQCSCWLGYSGNGTSCLQINECLEGTDDCPNNGYCMDTAGSFICDCVEGYDPVATADAESTCADVDECFVGTHTCHDEATCTNTDGAYVCSCNVGYTGSGESCLNVDECTDGMHTCDISAGCTDTDGSFQCTCGVGYEVEHVFCDDVNECDLATHDCHLYGHCINTDGSFTCQCQDGFAGNGLLCRDVHECDDSPCRESLVCVEELGGYECTAVPPTDAMSETTVDSVLLVAPSEVDVSEEVQLVAYLSERCGDDTSERSCVSPAYGISWTVSAVAVADEVKTIVAEANEKQVFEITIPPVHLISSEYVSVNFTVCVYPSTAQQTYCFESVKDIWVLPMCLQLEAHTSFTNNSSVHSDEDIIMEARITNHCRDPTLPFTFYWTEVNALIDLSWATDPTISLDADLLDADLSYEFRFEGCMAATGCVGFVARVYIAPAPLVVVIRGGGRRQGLTASLSVDASSSYDPDGLDLQTSWGCFLADRKDPKQTGLSVAQFNVRDDQPCFEGLADTTDLGKILVIDEIDVTPGTYYFTISAWTRTKAPLSTGVIVEVTDATAATVVVDGPSVLNAGNTLSLTCTVETMQGGEIDSSWIEWIVLFDDGETVEIDSSLILSVEGSWALVLAPGALERGQTYEILAMHSATSGMGSLTILVNSGPSSGSFDVTPANGVAFETTFMLSASGGWSDPESNLPLTYQYSQTLADGEEIMLCEPQYYSVLNTMLIPNHNPSLHPNVTVRLYVRDSLGALASIVETSVPVEWPDVNSETVVSYVTTVLDSQLRASLAIHDTALSVTYLSACGNLLNALGGEGATSAYPNRRSTATYSAGAASARSLSTTMDISDEDTEKAKIYKNIEVRTLFAWDDDDQALVEARALLREEMMNTLATLAVSVSSFTREKSATFSYAASSLLHDPDEIMNGTVSLALTVYHKISSVSADVASGWVLEETTASELLVGLEVLLNSFDVADGAIGILKNVSRALVKEASTGSVATCASSSGLAIVSRRVDRLSLFLENTVSPECGTLSPEIIFSSSLFAESSLASTSSLDISMLVFARDPSSAHSEGGAYVTPVVSILVTDIGTGAEVHLMDLEDYVEFSLPISSDPSDLGYHTLAAFHRRDYTSAWQEGSDCVTLPNPVHPLLDLAWKENSGGMNLTHMWEIVDLPQGCAEDFSDAYGANLRIFTGAGRYVSDACWIIQEDNEGNCYWSNERQAFLGSGCSVSPTLQFRCTQVSTLDFSGQEAPTPVVTVVYATDLDGAEDTEVPMYMMLASFVVVLGLSVWSSWRTASQARLRMELISLSQYGSVDDDAPLWEFRLSAKAGTRLPHGPGARLSQLLGLPLPRVLLAVPGAAQTLRPKGHSEHQQPDDSHVVGTLLALAYIDACDLVPRPNIKRMVAEAASTLAFRPSSFPIVEPMMFHHHVERAKLMIRDSLSRPGWRHRSQHWKLSFLQYPNGSFDLTFALAEVVCPTFQYLYLCDAASDVMPAVVASIPEALYSAFDYGCSVSAETIWATFLATSYLELSHTDAIVALKHPKTIYMNDLAEIFLKSVVPDDAFSDLKARALKQVQTWLTAFSAEVEAERKMYRSDHPLWKVWWWQLRRYLLSRHAYVRMLVPGSFGQVPQAILLVVMICLWVTAALAHVLMWYRRGEVCCDRLKETLCDDGWESTPCYVSADEDDIPDCQSIWDEYSSEFECDLYPDDRWIDLFSLSIGVALVCLPFKAVLLFMPLRVMHYHLDKTRYVVPTLVTRLRNWLQHISRRRSVLPSASSIYRTLSTDSETVECDASRGTRKPSFADLDSEDSVATFLTVRELLRFVYGGYFCYYLIVGYAVGYYGRGALTHLPSGADVAIAVGFMFTLAAQIIFVEMFGFFRHVISTRTCESVIWGEYLTDGWIVEKTEEIFIDPDYDEVDPFV